MEYQGPKKSTGTITELGKKDKKGVRVGTIQGREGRVQFNERHLKGCAYRDLSVGQRVCYVAKSGVSGNGVRYWYALDVQPAEKADVRPKRWPSGKTIRLTAEQRRALYALVREQFADRLAQENTLLLSDLAEQRELFVERVGYPPTRALFEAAREYFVFGYHNGKTAFAAIADRSLPVPETFYIVAVQLTDAQREMLFALVREHYGARLQADNCLPLSELGAIREICLERFGAAPEKDLFRSMRRHFCIGTDETGADCIALRDLPLPGRFRDDGVSVEKAAEEMPALDALYNAGQYAQFLRSPLFTALRANRISLRYLIRAINCAKFLLTPEDTAPVRLNALQKSLLTAADSTQFTDAWNGGKMKFSLEVMAQCAQSSLLPLPQTERAAIAARLRSCCSVDNRTQNTSYTELFKRMMYSGNELLPYVFVLMLCSYGSADSAESRIEEYCQYILSQAKNPLYADAPPGKRLMLLPEILRVTLTILFPDLSLSQTVKDDIIELLMDLDAMEYLPTVVPLISPERDAPEQRLLCLFRHFASGTEADYAAILDSDSDPALLRKFLAIVWQRWHQTRTGADVLPDELLRAMAWTLKHDSGVSVDQILRLRNATNNLWQPKAQMLLQSLERISALTPEEPALYNLGAYAAQTIWGELPESRRTDGLRAKVALWEMFAERYFRDMTRASGAFDEALFTVFREDRSRSEQLQKQYADWIKTQLRNSAPEELRAQLEALLEQGAYHTFAALYQEEYRKLAGEAPADDPLFLRYLDALRETGRFAEMIRAAQENPALPDVERDRVTLEALAANCSAYGLSPQADQALGAIGPAQAEQLLLRDVRHRPARAIPSYHALIAVYVKQNRVLQALYLFSFFSRQADPRYARLYEQMRAQFSGYEKRTPFHVLQLAFHTLPPEELLRFFGWASELRLPGFKDFPADHPLAGVYTQLLENPAEATSWRRMIQYLTNKEALISLNAWSVCVGESVLNLLDPEYRSYRETERALRLLHDEGTVRFPLYNLFVYLTPYVSVSGDILPLHWLERMLENAEFRSALFADSPWSDRYLAAKNAFAKYCARKYLETGRTTYHALLMEMWAQLEQEDCEKLMRTGADRGYLFLRVCANYLENRDHAKTVALLDEKNWPDLSFRESEMLRLTQMLYTDAQTLQEENPLLFRSEFDVPDFKEDCAEILRHYPDYTGLYAFLERCTDPVHRYAVLSYTIGIFYDEKIYQKGGRTFSELSDPRLRHAYLAYLHTCYLTQLEENMTYAFFYKAWRYLKLSLARVLQQCVSHSAAASDALAPEPFAMPSFDDIRARMEANGHAEGVLLPIFEPFIRNVSAFMNNPAWDSELREAFLFSIMTGESEEFFPQYKDRFAVLDKASCREAKFLLSCLDYREWNACFFKAYGAEILAGDFFGALHAAELVSDAAFDALTVLSATDSPEARRQFQRLAAVRGSVAKNVQTIFQSLKPDTVQWMGFLAPLLVCKQFVFLLYTVFRQKVISPTPDEGAAERDQALIEKTLTYLQDVRAPESVAAMGVLHHGVTSPGDVRRYLDALGLCFRGRRALANLKMRQGDTELQIPNSWKNEARKLQRYLESDNQSPFVPDYMVSGIADTDGSGGAAPSVEFPLRLQEYFEIEKRRMTDEEYETLSRDYVESVQQVREFLLTAPRRQIAARARDALQLWLSYRRTGDHRNQSGKKQGESAAAARGKSQLLMEAGLLALSAEDGLPDELRLQITVELYELAQYLKKSAKYDALLREHLDALKQGRCPLTAWQEYYPVVLELDNGRDRQLQELCSGVIDPSAALFEPAVTLEERREKLEALRIRADASRSGYALCVIRAIQSEIAQIDRGPRLEIEIQNEDTVTDGYVYFQLKNIGTRTVIVGAAESGEPEGETAVPRCTVRASFSNLDVPVENISRLRPGYITGGRARAASLREGETARLALWVEQDGARLCRCERTLCIETSDAVEPLDPNAEYKYQVEEAVTFGRLYGREQQMQQLERAIPNGIAVIFGPSRIGKTSLLNWVRNTLAAETRDNVLTVLIGGERKGRYRDYAVSFLDETTPVPFDADDNDRSMAEYLLIGPIRLALEKDPDRLRLPKNGGLTEALRGELLDVVRDSEKSALERLSKINGLLKAAGLELWLLLDEFQQAVERWTPKRSGQFLAACEQFSASSAVKLILCGSDELLKYMVLSNANVWRSIAGEDARISVGPLDAVPFKQMIREEKRALFDAYSYHEQALDVLRDYTGGIALYGKHICNAVLLNILNHPEEYRGRTTIYTYDIAEATEALLQKQTDELDKQEQIGIRTVYDNVIKGLGETEMQLLMLMADTLESRPEAVGFDVAGEFAGRTPQQGVNLSDALKIVENRQIIRRISKDSEIYDFRTLFYYHAFLGTARSHLNPALLFRTGAEDGETADWLFEVAEQLKRHSVTPGQVQDVLDAVMKSLPEDRRAEFREVIGERYGSGTVVHTEQYIEENAGTATHIGEQTTNIQINAQTITAAVTTLLGADATPDQIAAALSGMPSLRAYLPDPGERQRVQALAESLRRTGDAFDACFEEDGTCLDEAESERLGAQVSRTERELEEITRKAEQGVVRDTISAMVTLDSLAEVDEARWEAMLGVGPEIVARLKALPTEFFTPLSFAVTLHSIFDRIQDKHDTPLDYCPVAIMYCKVVEAMLKARHTPIYAARLGGETVSRDSGLVFSQLVDADGRTIPSKALTIGSFAFHIVFVDRNNDVDDRGSFYAAPKWKKILLITNAARRNDPDARLWARHASDLGLVLAVRNRSAHEAVPISKEAFDWLIETLFKNGELLRIWELSKP